MRAGTGSARTLPNRSNQKQNDSEYSEVNNQYSLWLVSGVRIPASTSSPLFPTPIKSNGQSPPWRSNILASVAHRMGAMGTTVQSNMKIMMIVTNKHNLLFSIVGPLVWFSWDNYSTAPLPHTQTERTENQIVHLTSITESLFVGQNDIWLEQLWPSINCFTFVPYIIKLSIISILVQYFFFNLKD